MGARFLAFDLGAESGRALTARLASGVLELAEVCRFANEPVRVDGSVYWDTPRLWLQMQRALERYPVFERLDRLGLDAWGCDYGLSGENAGMFGKPDHYPRTGTDAP